MNQRTVTGIFAIAVLLLFSSASLASEHEQELDIRVEKNPVTGQAFSGVVADGVSCISIEINLKGLSEGKLQYTKPLLGSIEGDTNKSGKEIEVEDGKAQVTYRPPSYIEESELLQRSETPDVWKAADSFKFIYNDSDGNRIEQEIKISVYRPPVVLAHGFIGDLDTWKKLDNHLAERKFDTVREEYYSSNQSIYDQTRALHERILNRMDSYTDNNIKLKRVDLVSHSMGGLTGRYYVNNAGYYEGNVRKLIMVATPNHGCNWNDLQTVIIQPWLESRYRASRQLYRDSSYLTELNSGEETGMHLNPDVEYGLIYSCSEDPVFFGGDAVVSAPSAYLNGVSMYKVQGKTHSKELSDMGPPIAEDEQVFAQIERWLGKSIKKPLLKEMDIRVMKIEGEAYIRAWSEDGGNDKRIDAALADSGKAILKPWNSVWTDEGRAMVSINTNGIPWGHIRLDANTNIRIGYVSPEVIEITMLQGGARYTSYRLGGGHFSVELLPKNGGWHNIAAVDTDFAVEIKDNASYVIPLKGNLRVIAGKPDNSISQTDVSKDSVTIDGAGSITQIVLQDIEKWWEDSFYKTSSTAAWAKGILNWLVYQMKNIPRWSDTGKIAGAAALLILMYLVSRRKRRFLTLLILIGGAAAAAIYTGLPYIGKLHAKTVILIAAVLTVLSFMGSLSTPRRKIRNWKRASYNYRKNRHMDDYGYEDYDFDHDDDFDGDD